MSVNASFSPVCVCVICVADDMFCPVYVCVCVCVADDMCVVHTIVRWVYAHLERCLYM